MGILKKLALVTIGAIALTQLEVALYPFRSLRWIYDALFVFGVCATPILCFWGASAVAAKRPLARAAVVLLIAWGSDACHPVSRRGERRANAVAMG